VRAQPNPLGVPTPTSRGAVPAAPILDVDVLARVTNTAPAVVTLKE
jgi:hypothetical protein